MTRSDIDDNLINEEVTKIDSVVPNRKRNRRKRKSGANKPQIHFSGSNCCFGLINPFYKSRIEYFENFYTHKSPIYGEVEVKMNITDERLETFVDAILVSYRKSMTDLRVIRQIQNMFGIRSGVNLFETLTQVKEATLSAIKTLILAHVRHKNLHELYHGINVGSVEVPDFVAEILSIISMSQRSHRIPGYEHSLLNFNLTVLMPGTREERDKLDNWNKLSEAIFKIEAFCFCFSGTKKVVISQFENFYKESKTFMSVHYEQGDEEIFHVGTKTSPESVFYSWILQTEYIMPGNCDMDCIAKMRLSITKSEFKTAMITYAYRQYGSSQFIPALETISAEETNIVKEIDAPLAG